LLSLPANSCLNIAFCGAQGHNRHHLGPAQPAGERGLSCIGLGKRIWPQVAGR
jgi:hypothetical protein